MSKIKLIAMALLIVLAIPVCAQNQTPKEQEIGNASTQLEKIELFVTNGNDGKVGCANKDGQVIIPCEYDDIDGYSSGKASIYEGFIRVKKNGKWGVIDVNNRTVIPFEYKKKTFIYYFSEGLCAVKDEASGAWGFVDAQNHLVIPFEYMKPKEFYNGLCLVDKDNGKQVIIDKNNRIVYNYVEIVDRLRRVRSIEQKYGFLDIWNKVIIPAEYDDVHKCFSEGLLGVEKDWKWGFVDENNKVVIPFEYENACPFSEGLAAVSKKEDESDRWSFNKYGCIDRNNVVVIPFEYERIGALKNGLAWADDKMIDRDNQVVYDRVGRGFRICDKRFIAYIENNGKWGFLDMSDNRVIIPLEYDNITGYIYENGFFEVNKNGKWGIVDTINRIVVPFEYDEIKRVSNNNIGVKKNNRWGVVDTDNHAVIPFEYDDIGFFSDGLFRVQKNGKWGFIDIDNHAVIPFEYDAINSSFKAGYARVEKNGKYYAINKNNILVYELGQSKIGLLLEGDDGSMVYKKGGKIGYIDEKYKVLIPAEYDGAFSFKAGCAIVKKNGKWGAVDKNNNVIISFEYDELYQIINDSFDAKKNGKWGKIDKNNKIVTPFIYDNIDDLK